jgi:hypothetical protein
MTRRTKVVAIVAGAIAATIVGTSGWMWLDTHVRWPLRIQRELLGREIVGYRALAHYEGDAHWGQGSFRWTYQLILPNALAKELCQGRPVELCRFERHGSPQRNVDTYIVYDHGRLTIEEWWM